MKACLQIGLLIFATVILGHAQDAVLDDAIDKCYENSMGNYCRDYDATIACLKKISSDTDTGKEYIEQAIRDEEAEKALCPGLKSTEICVNSELDRCMGHYYELYNESPKEICSESKKSRDCLVKFNTSCTVDVIGYDIEELDGIDDKCAVGHFDDGPCHIYHVRNCTNKFFNYFYQDPSEFSGAFACKTNEVVDAKKCLGKLKAMCTTKYQQKDIENEWESLNDFCPPAKNN